jgi:uncharacterized membrane protein
MAFSPILLLHICAGTTGVLSGTVAVSFRKGSRRHRAAGIVFAVSMLSLGASGAFMAFLKFQPGNILAGTFTFYLVATAWMTVKRTDQKISAFDWGALLLVLAVAVTEVTLAIEAMHSHTGLKYGYPAGPYLIFGSVALLALAGDVRMLVRRGISGTQRLARHLWRMCFAWFIASASIFLARPHLFPVFFRKTGLLILFTVLPLILMFFWLVRVRFAKAYRKKPIPPGVHVHSVVKTAPYSAGTGKPEASLQLTGTPR